MRGLLLAALLASAQGAVAQTRVGVYAPRIDFTMHCRYW